jgi:CubicO group peptidase (beta-lactamase class C family)
MTRGWSTLKLGPWVCVIAALGSQGCSAAEADDDAAPLAAELEQAPAFVQLLANDVPGFSVALVDDRGVLWSKGYGVKNLRTRQPVTADTAFWLASVSKAVMGTALTYAEEHRQLSLESDVRQLLRASGRFQLAVADGQALPLEQLVTHTSPVRDSKFYACSYYFGAARGRHHSLFNAFRGVSSGFSDPSLSDLHCDERGPVGLGDFLQAYLDPRGAYYLSDNFGSAGLPVYSNVGAGLAGYSLELATGSSLADYAAAHLFRPLGMQHTSWELRDFSWGEVATPYVWDETSSSYVELPLYGLATWPDGGLRSSARDLGRFLAAILHQGELCGTRILQPESVGRMLTPRVVDDVEGVGFGTFWATFLGDSGSLVGHTGSDPGAASLMLFEPSERLGVVLLSNTDFERLVEPLQHDLLGALFDAARKLHAVRRP